MGGSSYDRDVYSSSSTINWGASDTSTSRLSSSMMASDMNPRDKILRSSAKHPIIIILDVTGSNIDFARIVYDKMPLFYGEIIKQGYLDDIELSVCAVGDEECDSYPLQIADFAKGTEIDTWMEKLVLESGGGGNQMESYELAAYYLAHKTEFDISSKPVVFFIGDEEPYPKVKRNEAVDYNIPYKSETDGFSDLKAKFGDRVYMFLNPYCGRTNRQDFFDTWTSLLGKEHVIKIPKDQEKSIIDQLLGVLALLKGKTLNNYVLDMKNRDQSQMRIETVTNALGNLANSLVPIEQINLPVNGTDHPKTLTKGKRIS